MVNQTQICYLDVKIVRVSIMCCQRSLCHCQLLLGRIAALDQRPKFLFCQPQCLPRSNWNSNEFPFIRVSTLDISAFAAPGTVECPLMLLACVESDGERIRLSLVSTAMSQSLLASTLTHELNISMRSTRCKKATGSDAKFPCLSSGES